VPSAQISAKLGIPSAARPRLGRCLENCVATPAIAALLNTDPASTGKRCIGRQLCNDKDQSLAAFANACTPIHRTTQKG